MRRKNTSNSITRFYRDLIFWPETLNVNINAKLDINVVLTTDLYVCFVFTKFTSMDSN